MKYFYLLFLSLALTGCGSTRHLAFVDNGGQTFKEVRLLPDGSPDPATLGVRDTVVIAVPTEGVVNISASNKLRISLKEEVNAENTPVQLDLKLRLPTIELAKPAPAFRIAVKKEVLEIAGIKLTQNAGNVKDWIESPELNPWWLPLSAEQVKAGSVPVSMRILAFNVGNAPFDGNFSFVDRFDGKLKFSQVTRSGYVSQAAGILKAIAGGLTLGFASSLLEDFGVRDVNSDTSRPLQGSPQFDEINRILQYRLANLKLEPGEGIELVMNMQYELPKGEELLRIRSKEVR